MDTVSPRQAEVLPCCLNPTNTAITPRPFDQSIFQSHSGENIDIAFGEKGVVNLGKAVPLAGGVVGAIADSVPTKIIGNVARDTFIGPKA